MVLNKVLYAPWRKDYWTSDTKKNSKNSKTCVFCHPSDSEVIFSTKTAYIQANKYPYAAGQLLIIVKRHINQIIDLTSKERTDIFNLIDLSIYALKIYMDPEGFNVGCSVGEVAGESINHLHFHVLPRRKGDIGWNRLCDFEVVSISPEQVVNDIKEIIQKNKLKTKFDL